MITAPVAAAHFKWNVALLLLDGTTTEVTSIPATWKLHDGSVALRLKYKSKPLGAVSNVNVSSALDCWLAIKVDPRKLPVMLGCAACTAKGRSSAIVTGHRVRSSMSEWSRSWRARDLHA